METKTARSGTIRTPLPKRFWSTRRLRRIKRMKTTAHPKKLSSDSCGDKLKLGDERVLVTLLRENEQEHQTPVQTSGPKGVVGGEWLKQ